MPSDPALLALLRFGFLALAAAFFVGVFLVARSPGGRPGAILLGGLVSGFLLGPAVFGAARPGLFERVTRGAVAERLEVESLRAEHELQLEALGSTGVSDVAIAEHRAELQAQLAEPLARLHAAEDRFHRPVRRGAMGLVCAAALLGGVASQRRAWGQPGAVAGGVAAGVLGALFGGLITALLLGWCLNLPRSEALRLGVAVAGGSMLCGTPLRCVGAAGRSLGARAWGMAGLVVSLVAIATLPADTELGPWLAGVLLAWAAGLWFGRTAPRQVRRTAKRLLQWLVLPAIAAYAMSSVHLTVIMASGGAVAFVVASVLLAGGGSWVGTVLGYGVLGNDEQRVRTTSRWLESQAGGQSLTQACLLTVLLGAGLVDGATATGSALVLGVLLAGLSCEMATAALRKLLAMPVEATQE